MRIKLASFVIQPIVTAIKEFNLLVIKENNYFIRHLLSSFLLKKKLYCNKTVYNTKIWFIENL